MADKKFEYGQCKRKTIDENGKQHRCRLGVWKDHPQDGLCFMHSDKAKYKGGAALNAIKTGKMEPLTRKARLAQEQRKADPPQAPGQRKTFRVCFTQHILSVKNGAASKVQCVGFDLQREANQYANILKRRDDSNPIWSEDGYSFSFFSDVRLA